MKRLLLITACLLTVLGLRAQSLRTCRYWFDRDFGDAVTTSFNGNSGQLQLNVGALPERLHTLHLQVADSSLNWGPTKSYLFMKNEDYSQENLSYRCWFDQDYDSSVSENLVNGTFLLDVSGLRSGMHTVHLLLESSSVTSTKSYLFMKPENYGFEILSYRYWFDQDYQSSVNDSLVDGAFLLDVSELSSGMHTLHLMFESSTVTSTKSFLFMKPENYGFEILSYRYWFDRDYESSVIESFGDGSFLLDVSGLKSGMHTLHLMFEGSTKTSTKNYLFMKPEDYSFVSYRCWFDYDYNIGNQQTGSLESGTMLLDVSDLSNGIHTMHIQFEGSSMTSTKSYLFLKVPETEDCLYRCWFDQDESTVQTGQVVGSGFLLDVSALSIGQHDLFVQLSRGDLSSPRSYTFFHGPNITVIANPEEGGTVSTQLVDSICTITATANQGYSFVNWTENGSQVTTETNYSFVVTENDIERTFVANFMFAGVNYTVNATANPVEGGMVEGAGTYAEGETCTLTAMPAEGYYFMNWTQGGTVVSSTATYSFVVEANVNLVANFAEGIYIGDGGTATSQYLPSYSYYNYSLTQQIYTAEEIGTSGMITSIAFFNGGAEKTRTYDFYMKHTTKSNFSNNTDWIAVSPSDMVFSGSVTMVADGWTMITFDTPFVYDGTSNVVFVADDNSDEWSPSPHMSCRVFDVDDTQAIYKYADGTNYNPYNPSEYSGTRLSEKNQIILGMGSASDFYVISATANPTEGGNVTGGGTYNNGSVCTLMATPNDGYTFMNWTKDNVEVSTEATYSFTVTENATYVANFILNQGEVTQENTLAQGYNWWSTYIEQEGINGLEMLENSLGGNGVAIRSQASGYTDYYGEDYGWWGSLTSINNESSYRVVTNAPCTVSMTGNEAVPSQHPITLNHGWTWMGYVPSTAMDVNTAMAGMEASDGDMLKSQQGYADYYPNYGWYGSLNTIEPGMGLMYYSASGETVTFTYPDNTRSGELRKNLTAEHNHWKPNTFAYPDNMTVMAVVELNEMELKSDNYELAAFAANGECRGSVRLTYAEPLHRHVAFLTISGKDAAELSFRLYDTETGMEYYDAEESLDFVANAIMGEADDLYTIHFRGTTGMDELVGKVQVYPNPVNAGERFSINVADDVKNPVRVEIVNALGVETMRATSVQTPAQLTAPATAGVYTLRITVEGKGTVVRKLVVK